MKVMLRRSSEGKLVAYVAKKDLEEEVIQETETEQGTVLTLTNGWELAIANLPDPLKLPVTVEAKRLT